MSNKKKFAVIGRDATKRCLLESWIDEPPFEEFEEDDKEQILSAFACLCHFEPEQAAIILDNFRETMVKK